MSQVKYEHPYRTGNWSSEIYPMPAFPNLLVSDAERSYRWYLDVLGFADVFTARGPSGGLMIAHLRWCRFGDVLLIPARTPVEEPRGRGILLNFAAEEVDAFAERIRAAGAAIEEGPLDRPWNTRDVTVRDPDGYRLNFTAPQTVMLERYVAGEVPSMDSILEKMRAQNVVPGKKSQ